MVNLELFAESVPELARILKIKQNGQYLDIHVPPYSPEAKRPEPDLHEASQFVSGLLRALSYMKKVGCLPEKIDHTHVLFDGGLWSKPVLICPSLLTLKQFATERSMSEAEIMFELRLNVYDTINDFFPAGHAKFGDGFWEIVYLIITNTPLESIISLLR